MRQDFSWPHAGFGLAISVLLGLLALSETPQARRLKVVNEALSNVEVDPARLQLLRDQVAWIMRNTDLGETAHMSQSVALDRLDVVVTDASFADITRTGRANAIYDPGMKAIFIDSYLLDPVDAPFLGTDGPAAAFSEADFGFWNASLSFVIAHELGHHAAGDSASAFFSADWLRQNPSEVDEELAADAYALEVLARAYADPAMPEMLVETNALSLFGLDFSDLAGAERAAGDMIGAMKVMTVVMQFLSGPYSPFYQDTAHPSFLARVLLAVNELPLGPESVVRGQSHVLIEEIRRQLKAAERRFIEIQAPGPIARVAAADGEVFVAVRSLIHGREDESLSKIYRMRLPDAPGGLGFDLLAAEDQSSKMGEDHNAWIEAQLAEKAPGVGTLGLASETGTVPQLRLFEAFDQFQPDGFAFVDDGWVLPPIDALQVTTREAAEAAIQAHLGEADVDLGPPVAREDALIFPVYLPQANTFRVVSARAAAVDAEQRELAFLDEGTPVVVSEPSLQASAPPTNFEAEFSPQDGWIDIEGARWTGEDWIVPGRAGAVWELHRGGEGRPWVTQARERLLADFIAETGEASFGRDLDPQGASLLVLNPDAALIWYDRDSVWLSTPEATVPVFHPAAAELRITRIDATRALFWASNGTKAYLINIVE